MTYEILEAPPSKKTYKLSNAKACFARVPSDDMGADSGMGGGKSASGGLVLVCRSRFAPKVFYWEKRAVLYVKVRINKYKMNRQK